MKKFLFISLLALSSCCSEYEALLNSRLGISENELIEEVGNPTSVYSTGEMRSLEYKNTDFYCHEYGCETDSCTVQYIIKNGEVERWSYRGDCCL